MSIIERLKLWYRQNKCNHSNFKNISSTTFFIDSAKRFPARTTYIRECTDCRLLYEQDSVRFYRAENTYSIFPSNQIRRLSKKEREKFGK